MRIGIDLLWVRVGICGGTESYIRNLLDGFVKYADDQEYVLFAARDNAESFRHYEQNACVTICECSVDCANQAKRILWENLHLDKWAKRNGVDIMFIPVYSKPMSFGSKIPYVTVIHDLQALHYPEYFSRIKRMFLKYTWWNTCRTSDMVITDSDFCRKDLMDRYPCVRKKVRTIYLPVNSTESGAGASCLQKYHVEPEKYYYCVSSMLPHKNLDTIFSVIQEQKKRGLADSKLVLSGVGGEEQKVRTALRELQIEDRVVLTGFVSNEERDCLYENCKLFLFPSIFEGFGMPPIEAMRKGKKVVMTDKTCLKEVTEGKAVYVEDPYDVEEWLEKIEEAQNTPGVTERFEKYELRNIVNEYMETYERLLDGR